MSYLLDNPGDIQQMISPAIAEPICAFWEGKEPLKRPFYRLQQALYRLRSALAMAKRNPNVTKLPETTVMIHPKLFGGAVEGARVTNLRKVIEAVSLAEALTFIEKDEEPSLSASLPSASLPSANDLCKCRVVIPKDTRNKFLQFMASKRLIPLGDAFEGRLEMPGVINLSPIDIGMSDAKVFPDSLSAQDAGIMAMKYLILTLRNLHSMTGFRVVAHRCNHQSRLRILSYPDQKLLNKTFFKRLVSILNKHPFELLDVEPIELLTMAHEVAKPQDVEDSQDTRDLSRDILPVMLLYLVTQMARPAGSGHQAIQGEQPGERPVALWRLYMASMRNALRYILPQTDDGSLSDEE